MRRFGRLSSAERCIVVYAEDASSWVHLGPIVEALTTRQGRSVTYLTSSLSDPVLEAPPARVRAFYVGEGWSRTYLFTALEARVVVMTMPDLETFHIKRSRAHAVRYVYVFHSIVSTHMIYRPAAFDHYDTVLCVGPHHVAEIRAREALQGLPAKELVEHGYGRLEAILERARGARAEAPPLDPMRVLIAPSWGPDGLLETRGAAVVDVLLQAGFHVTIRPHPVVPFPSTSRVTPTGSPSGFRDSARPPGIRSDPRNRPT